MITSMTVLCYLAAYGPSTPADIAKGNNYNAHGYIAQYDHVKAQKAFDALVQLELGGKVQFNNYTGKFELIKGTDRIALHEECRHAAMPQPVDNPPAAFTETTASVFIMNGTPPPEFFIITDGPTTLPLVTIRLKDGLATFGPNFTQDEASRVFWQVLGASKDWCK